MKLIKMKNTTYKITKSTPFGESGETVSFDEKSRKWKTSTGEIVEKKYLSNTDFFEEIEGNKKRKPDFNEDYYYIDDYGDVCSDCFREEREDFFRVKTGNYYLSKNSAQNKLDLINHIVKFEEPKKGEWFYYLTNNNSWVKGQYTYGDHCWSMVDFQAGLVLNKRSTKEDHKERLRLIDLVYKK